VPNLSTKADKIRPSIGCFNQTRQGMLVGCRLSLQAQQEPIHLSFTQTSAKGLTGYICPTDLVLHYLRSVQNS